VGKKMTEVSRDVIVSERRGRERNRKRIRGGRGKKGDTKNLKRRENVTL